MKPIVFNTKTVQAILEGRKTVTRRPVKPQPDGAHMVMDCDEEERTFDFLCGGVKNGMLYDRAETVKAPYWPGDVLWVKETWAKDIDGEFVYRTDYGTTEDDSFPPSMFKWRHPICMPKEAARIFLRVKDVRVERLQEINNESARAEGCDGRCEGSHDGGESDWTQKYDFSVERFQTIWDSTIKPKDLPLYSWNANPWVWVVSFERLSKEESYCV